MHDVEPTEFIRTELSFSRPCTLIGIFRTLLLTFGEWLTSFRTPFVVFRSNIILPVVVYGCEPRSFTLREEHRLTFSENKVLRKILRLNIEEVPGD
jgi:hypothetical protein